MSKHTDSSIKLLVLYDILLKSADEEHALSTSEITGKMRASLKKEETEATLKNQKERNRWA